MSDLFAPLDAAVRGVLSSAISVLNDLRQQAAAKIAALPVYNDLYYITVSLWQMGESSDRSTNVIRIDSKGPNHLASTNRVASVSGKINNAALFEYVNNEVLSIVDSLQSGLDPLTGDFSICFWLKLTSFPEFLQTIVAKQIGAGGGYTISVRNNGQMSIVIGDGTVTVGAGIYHNTGLILNVWNWIDVELKRAENMRLYVNNVLKGSMAISAANRSINNASPFNVGRLASNSQRADCAIFQIIYCNALKTPARQAALYNNGNGVSSPFFEVDPAAAFSSSVSGAVVTFTDQSLGAIKTYAWTFGDGNTSLSQNPQHTYAQAGTYTVALTVTDYEGNHSVASHSVTIAVQNLTVTTLADSGAGSLRAALLTPGERVVRYAVAGEIALSTPILVTNAQYSYLTWDGADELVTVSGHAPIFQHLSHLTLRYLRLHRGDTPIKSGEDGDPLGISGDLDTVLVEFCSFYHGLDSALDLVGTNITVRDCILAETYRHSINDSEGAAGHSMGSLWQNCTDVLFQRVLIAHCGDRVPAVQDGDRVQLINVVSYDTINSCPKFGEKLDAALTRHGVVAGCSNISGPSTLVATDSVARYGMEIDSGNWQLYAHGNRCDKRTSDAQPESDALLNSSTTGGGLVGSPYTALPGDTMTAPDALTYVLANAGATLPSRDTDDARIVAEVANRTGSVIDSPLWTRIP